MLILAGAVPIAVVLLLFTLAPMVGQPRRVVAVLVVGVLLDVGLFLLLRIEPTLSPRSREVIGLLVLGALVVALYLLVVWFATVGRTSSPTILVAGLVTVFPWVLVIVASLVSVQDRRHERRRSVSIDPVRLFIIALVMTAAWFNRSDYDLRKTYGHEVGVVAVSLVVLAVAVVMIMASRLQPSPSVGGSGPAEPEPLDHAISAGAHGASTPGANDAGATGPVWLEYGILALAIVVVLGLSLLFLPGGHVSHILAPVTHPPPRP